VAVCFYLGLGQEESLPFTSTGILLLVTGYKIYEEITGFLAFPSWQMMFDVCL
jgi:hypothetical protein